MSSRRRSKTGPICTAPNTVCRNPAIRLTFDGQSHQSLYCRYHACRKVDSNRPCPMAKLPKAEFCANHMKCLGMLHGIRCTQNVKDDNPSTYKFCSLFHICLTDGCKDGRQRKPSGEDLRHCAKHRCRHEDCAAPRGDGSPYCAEHTCEYASCSTLVEGGGAAPGDPARFCDRHRRCKAPQCWRFCNLRGSGAVAPFCASHCCEAEDCDEQRRGRSHCPAHACVETGCGKGKAGTAQFCKDHKCKDSGCPERRTGDEYCPRHKCLFEGCQAEGGLNGCCAEHQNCSQPDCVRRRYSASGTVYPNCEIHHFGVCHGADGRSMCGRRVERGTSYCDAHLCHVRECREPQMTPSPYCGMHKCMSPACVRPRRAPAWGFPFQQGFGGGFFFFCDVHACAQQGCQDRAEDDSRFCPDHRKCRERACGRAVERDGDDPTVCGRHQPKPEAGGQQQVPPLQQMPMPMPMPSMVQQRPLMYSFSPWQQPWPFMGGQLG